MKKKFRRIRKISTNNISITSRKIVKKLDEERGNGRNDYPVVCMWCLYLAEFVFLHQTIESLLRECRRNSQLRQLCGLRSHYISMNHTNNHVCIVPSSVAMSRFIKKLKEHQENLTEMMLILEKK